MHCGRRGRGKGERERVDLASSHPGARGAIHTFYPRTNVDFTLVTAEKRLSAGSSLPGSPRNRISPCWASPAGASSVSCQNTCLKNRTLPLLSLGARSTTHGTHKARAKERSTCVSRSPTSSSLVVNRSGEGTLSDERNNHFLRTGIAREGGFGGKTV